MQKDLVNYAFIDGQNFFKSVEELEKELEALEVRLNLKEFRTYLKEKHGVKIAFYFLGLIPAKQGLYRYLTNQGYELNFKEVAIQNGEVKGNVDVNLTLHVLDKINEYSKAIIIASDGDYACLVEYLHDHSKFECLIACSRRGSSHLLRKLHGKIKIFYLDDIMRDLYKRKETS
ncbi:hypothetical protein B1772_00290 [Dehalococcoides mccartyi]|jgi:hypothetical protein|uniref:NYN domain-containing protein n=1 Tax=Dehalococcoides TaxID=61434 RepID=UPI00099CBAA9|nr:NYN domain-containing protein [Dehalococcoides mccartyi]AQX74030.1 hypothetical protein B1776_00300 [Dehalococcoides mccartyi]AQY72543.1 hypothetical protein B1772_00290 [Dehalococcoides mccartyi]